MRTTDGRDKELDVVVLFSALGLAVSAAVISAMPEDAMGWAIAHIKMHLDMMPKH